MVARSESPARAGSDPNDPKHVRDDLSDALKLGTCHPPDIESIRKSPDTLRANASICQLVGMCSVKRTIQDKPSSIHYDDMIAWVARTFPAMGSDAVATMLPDEPCGPRMESCASTIVYALIDGGAITRSQAKKGSSNMFVYRDRSSGDEELGASAHDLARRIVRAYCHAVDASIALQTSDLIKRAYVFADSLDPPLKHSESQSRVADFLDCWLAPRDPVAASEPLDPEWTQHFERFEAILPESSGIVDHKRVIAACRKWTAQNWQTNVHRQADRKSMRMHREMFGPASPSPPRRGAPHVVKNDQKVFCVDLVQYVECALVYLTCRSPVYGRPPISTARNMGGWMRAQGTDADASRRAFAQTATRVLEERGQSRFATTCVGAISTCTRRAVVSFGDDMFGGEVATTPIRDRDARDLVHQCGDSPLDMAFIVAGMLASAFTNVILWRGTTRHVAVYAVNRTEGWSEAHSEEIATIYCAAAVRALDDLRSADHMGGWWRDRFEAGSFASNIGDGVAEISKRIQLLLDRRVFLATSTSFRNRLQELDLGAHLPLTLLRACPDAEDGSSEDHDNGIELCKGTSSEDVPDSAVDAGHVGQKWGTAAAYIGIDPALESTEVCLLDVPCDPPIRVVGAHLKAMGVDLGRRREWSGAGCYVKIAGEWVIPREQTAGSVYIEDIHALGAIPWPRADTLAAFSASAYGPSGETWEAVVLMFPDSVLVEGPHVRAQVHHFHPYVRNTRWRNPRRPRHCLQRTLPFVSTPVVARYPDDNVKLKAWMRLQELAADTRSAQRMAECRTASYTTTLVSSSGGGSRSSDDVDTLVAAGVRDDFQIVSHQRAFDRGVHHPSFEYLGADGTAVTVPSGTWGDHGRDAYLKSQVRRYWSDVHTTTLDEFLDDPIPATGRMCPHDAPKRLVRPRVFVMNVRGHIVFHEIALDRVRALAAWDRDAAIVEEREECFVYILSNTLEQEYPLVVVAGLRLDPFVPTSVHELICKAWCDRGEACPHFDRTSVDYRPEDESTVKTYFDMASELPFSEEDLSAWFKRGR